jgi:hypothetical protein
MRLRPPREPLDGIRRVLAEVEAGYGGAAVHGADSRVGEVFVRLRARGSSREGMAKGLRLG